MSSPIIRIIGNRDLWAEGKVLFEILAQLKNFGIGRMVTKNIWAKRWPSQPSYCIVRKVEANMDRWLMHGTMWADFVYRGKPMGVFEFDRQIDRADWRLIHKCDEENFAKCDKPFQSRKVPSKVPMPPLQRYLHKQKLIKEGKDQNVEPPMIPMNFYPDEEHKFLNKFTEFRDDLAAKPNGTIYDIDKILYSDLYGELLPVKMEEWRSASEFLWNKPDERKKQLHPVFENEALFRDQAKLIEKTQKKKDFLWRRAAIRQYKMVPQPVLPSNVKLPTV